MVLIIICAQLLLMCAHGVEPKIVYSRPVRNDTTMVAATVAAAAVTEPLADTSVETDDYETSTTAAATAAAAAAAAAMAVAAASAATATSTMTTTTAAAEQSPTGRRYADSNKSMSTKTNYYGVQFYPPPVVHHAGGAADVFGRPVHLPPAHQHRLHHRPAAYYQQRQRGRPQWDPTVVPVDGVVDDDDDDVAQPILVNPLLAAYGDPSTARYAPAKAMQPANAAAATVAIRQQQRAQPPLTARLKWYAATEPAAAAVQPFQLPSYLHAADAGDRALLETLPAIRFALHHAAGKTQPQAAAAAAAAASATDALLQQYALQQSQQQSLQHHHAGAATVKQPPVAAAGPLHHHHPHQLHYQPHHHHHQRLSSAPPPLPLPPPPPPPHHLYQHHHHTSQPHQLHHRYGVHPARYTQVPFLYNLPPPPPSHHRHLAPAEYDLVTRFNRLLKQRERDDVRAAAAAAAAADAAATDDYDEDEAAKPQKAKKKKKKRKKRPRPATTPVPAPVEEEPDEEPDDKQLSQQADDERPEDEQPVSEEQESQYVHTSEKLPEGTLVHETEDHLQNVADDPAQLSEQFGGDLTFEDSDGERVEFQLHGLGGPESYKFGFDTGKGTNRQFRYEERDSDGNVRGHYGYKDSDGKMQVYNYSSHPEYGFHAEKAETPPETQPEK